MAPTKKSRTVKKRFSSLSDVSPEKDIGNASRTVQLKKKLSDKLGSQWSKEELERFYEAYRKHGKDWKKVAAIVRNRSTEMVEALYIKNRAYLNLDEGKASLVGLIAMMTDHYNDDSGSERESIDAPEISQKPQKRKRAKVQLSILREDHYQSQSATSIDGCLSLLKKRRTDGVQPRAVGKRTPRFPVSYNKKDDRNNYVSPNKRGRKSEVVDDDGLHVAALALTEASKQGGSPQVSQTPRRKTLHANSSPVQSWERMSEIAPVKVRDACMDDDWVQGIRTIAEETGGYARDTKALIHIEGVGTVDVSRRGKKFNRKKEKAEDIGNNQYDDGGEACSGTEGLNICALRRKDDLEVSNARPGHSSPQGQRKRSKNHLLGVSRDESSALDALHALADLADLSETMPAASTMESESSVQLKEERTPRDLDDKPSAHEATSTSRYREKIKFLGPKEKEIYADFVVEGSNSRKSKLGRDSLIDITVVTEAKQSLSASKASKRKRKPIAPKVNVSNTESRLEAHPNELESEDLAEEWTKFGAKGKLSMQIPGLSKQRKSTKVSEGSFISEQKRAGVDLPLSIAQVPALNQVNLPTKQRSRRKLNLPRFFIPEEMKLYENHSTLKSQSNKYPAVLPEGLLHLKKKLLCCLSSHMVRRWCTFEWFYSAIDFPWFAKSEFVEYLNHVGLGHIPRLTRVEWGVIRSSLGKPRRFSEQFLYEEREKLKQYRESVRKHYTELRNGTREGLPTDLARPLSVGQRVVALHPKTREVYNGSVLTVDHDKCRVQFDRPEIGVEFVKDIDCMPSNPLDNMPEALRRQSIAVDKFSGIPKEQANGCSNFVGSMLYTSSVPVENVISPMNTSAKLAKGDGQHALSKTTSAVIDSPSGQQTTCSQPYTVTHVQAREADVRALSEMTRALDKKEALLLELRSRNNEVLQNQTYGDGSLKDSEVFKKHYATVLVQLREASGQVANSLHNLRERNTYPGNPLPPWLKLPLNSSLPCGLPSSLNNNSYSSQEQGSKVVQIVKGSRAQAHAMVDAAIQAMSLLGKGGEDAFTKIGEALDSLDTQKLPFDSKEPMISAELVNGNQYQLMASEPNPPNQTSSPGSNDPDTQIPSELITSCVSTLLMIQTCTERQYPPAEVAQILDFAVTSLKPCCDRNQPIYREIQMSMGRLKTQILALIPTSI